MKNHPALLFVAGVIIGGVVMLCVLGFQQIAGSSSANAAPVETSPSLPRLIALEATDAPISVIPTPLSPTPSATSIAIHSTTTTTPLALVHEQEPEVIGYSVEGRPLNVYTFGNGGHQRMVVADIHGGDEWNTLTLANQLVQYVNAHPEVIPADVTLYILPGLNPDGEARAHNKYGRLNHNGVDLNRNFPVNWLADWDRAGCWNYLPTSGGAGPGSEAETQALMSFIESHQIEALVSYHSAALGIFPGGDPADENSMRLAESVAQVSTYPYPPLDTGCTYSGSLPDYAVSRGIAAVDLELTNHFDTDLDVNLKILEVLLNWE